MRLSEPIGLNEWVVLTLLCEGPSHGFALARQLEPETDLGRIFTVHRPLVYRAIDRLIDGGMAAKAPSQRGTTGPRRQPVHVAEAGRAAAERWLASPVDHIRDLRIEFLVKMRLLERSGLDPAKLLEAQQRALADRLESLRARDPNEDVVDRWRRHNAVAVTAFLADS